MTKTSALRAAIAVALSAAAGVAAAQTYEVAPSGSMSPPTLVTPGPVDPQAGTTVYTAPAYSTPSMHHDFRSACAGLADRQTERACKERYRTSPDNANPSLKGNDTGNVDDQAG